MATKKVQIHRDDAIKGRAYKAGQVAEFDEHVAAAIVFQKRGQIVSDETPLTPENGGASSASPTNKKR